MTLLHADRSSTSPFIGEVPLDPSLQFKPFTVAADDIVFDTRVDRVSSPSNAFEAVRNGFMPANAGLVAFTNPEDEQEQFDLDHEVGAVDLVAFYSTDLNTACFLPTSKEAVDDISRRLQTSGIIALTMPERERVKVVALVESEHQQMWAEPRPNTRPVGRTAVKFFGIDAPEYEVVDTSPLGLAFGKLRNPLVSIPRNITSH